MMPLVDLTITRQARARALRGAVLGFFAWLGVLVGIAITGAGIGVFIAATGLPGLLAWTVIAALLVWAFFGAIHLLTR